MSDRSPRTDLGILPEHDPQAIRKIEAYDAARAKVKREGFSRAEYVLRAFYAERQLEKLIDDLAENSESGYACAVRLGMAEGSS